MRYLKNYSGFSLNEAAIFDATKLSITVDFSKVDKFNKKEIEGYVTFIYEGNVLNAQPIVYKFKDANDRWVYNSADYGQGFSVVVGGQKIITAESFRIAVLKSAVEASKKATITKFGTDNMTFGIATNKNGAAWIAAQLKTNLRPAVASLPNPNPNPNPSQIVSKVAPIINIVGGFDLSKFDLKPEMTKNIDTELAKVTDKNIKLKVDGYASADGDPTQDLELSKNRSKAVADYIISKGFKNVTFEGHGQTKQFSETDPTQNRRITVTQVA